MKKSLAIILIVSMFACFFITGAAAAGTPAFAVSSGSAEPGEEVTLTISAKNNPGIAAFEVAVEYDPEMLEWVSVKKGGMDGTWDIQVGSAITWIGTELLTEDAVLATLVFRIKDGASGETQVSVSYDADDVFDLNEDNVYFDVTSGTVTAKPHEHTWGDWTVTVPVTCTADGSRYHTCTACGETETEVIKSEGHKAGSPVRENDAAPTCEEDGSYDLAVYCTECSVELSRETVVVKKLGHEWGEWETVKAATVTQEGLKQRVCKNDPTHIETSPIPKLNGMPGDVNGDGKVNNKDVTRLMRYIKYHNTQEIEVVKGALDVNGDGKVNNKDVTRLMRFIKYKNVDIFFNNAA